MAEQNKQNKEQRANLSKTKAVTLAKMLHKARQEFHPDREDNLTDIRYSSIEPLFVAMQNEDAFINARFKTKTLNPNASLSNQSVEFFNEVSIVFASIELGKDVYGVEQELLIAYNEWYGKMYPRKKRKFTDKNLTVANIYDYCVKNNVQPPLLDGVKSINSKLINWSEEGLKTAYQVLQSAA